MLEKTIDENIDKDAAAYTARFNEGWYEDVAMTNYYFYGKTSFTHLTSRPRYASQHMFDEWKEYADYVIVVTKDELYEEYCEKNGINPETNVLYADE